MSTGSQMVKPDAQGQSWERGGLFRLSTTAFVSEERSERPILVVAIHGDAPFDEPDYHYDFAAKLAASHRDVIAVGLLRPGYTDPEGHTSDGELGEAVGDNFHVSNTDPIADVIGELKRRWNARKVVVAAHSGGGTLAANMLGRHPTLIDQALLVSSISDVEKWRQYMFEQTGETAFQGEMDTLSPIDQIAEMSHWVEVTLMVGSQDETAARKLGKIVKLVRLEGEGHEICLNPAVFAELEPMLKAIASNRPNPIPSVVLRPEWVKSSRPRFVSVRLLYDQYRKSARCISAPGGEADRVCGTSNRRL